MRITAIELSGFRGFAQKQEFDLDANAIVIVGANGQGKTSLFDGVLWALTGNIPRLGDDQVISMYSESGEARVSLTLRTTSNEFCHLVRSFDGKEQRLRLEFNGEVLRDPMSSTRLLQTIWPEALLAANSVASLATAITRSVYLQQDLVRQFIEADTEQDRFKSAGELIGAGRVTELQLALERARTAWTRATNQYEQDANAVRLRLRALEQQLERLAHATGDARAKVETVWTDWWKWSQQMGITISQVPAAGSVEAPAALDAAVKELGVLRRQNERRRDLAAELIAEIESRAAFTIPDDASLRKALEVAEHDVRTAREALAEAESRAAEERRHQVELREAREELRVLAQLALRHLGPECPVCAQRYDKVATRKRLERLVGTPAVEDSEPPSAQNVTALANMLEQRERARAAAEAELRKAEEISRGYRGWITGRDRRCRELGIDPSSEATIMASLRELYQKLGENTTALAAHQEKGEQLALTLAQAAELARRTELEQEIVNVRTEVENFDKSLRSRNQTGDLANQILEGLRDAVYFVVEEQLQRIEPLLHRIYATMDPHPAFRAVRFLTRFSRGRGRLDTEINDPFAALSSDSPRTVLSSSQMNALAAAIFLAFNLGVKSLPLQAAMLDDPLQSLDDVNLLGLIDLLRRVRDQRQLIVSTHDARFGRLLERKLRPVQDGQRTIVIEFKGWSRQGPDVEVREVARDPKPLRIVAHA